MVAGCRYRPLVASAPPIRLLAASMRAVPSFGQQLRSLRERAQLSQPQLAAAIRVSRQWLSAVEAGEETPTIARVEQMVTTLTRHIYGDRLSLAHSGEVTELRAQLIQAAVDQRINGWFAGTAARADAYRQRTMQTV